MRFSAPSPVSIPLEECFGELAPAIPALETGLSSDPAMNWRVPDADGRSIVSFSDAHSLRNLGREATAFQGPLTFDGLAAALKEERIAYTVEYYPEEGKYHATGHRACNVRYLPADTQAGARRVPSAVVRSRWACSSAWRRWQPGRISHCNRMGRLPARRERPPALQACGPAYADLGGSHWRRRAHQDGCTRLHGAN